MTITVMKTSLVQALEGCSLVLPHRTSVPLMSALRLSYRAGTLMLEALADLGVRFIIVADSGLLNNGELDVMVSAHLMAQLARNMPGEKIELNAYKGELTMTSGVTNFKLPLFEISQEERDARSPDLQHGTQVLTLQAHDLVAAVAGVRYAASSEAFQAVFRGLAVELERDFLRFVGSDGFRLAVCELPLPSAAPRRLVVLAQYFQDLLKLLGKDDIPLALSVTDSHLIVMSERVGVSMPLLDAVYADWQRVLPRDSQYEVRTSTPALLEAVSRVAVMTDKNANFRVEVTLQERRLLLMAQSDYGVSTDTVEAEVVGGGEGLTLAFNAKYLREALATHRGNLSLFLKNTMSPVLLTSEAPGLRSVLMPLRV